MPAWEKAETFDAYLTAKKIHAASWRMQSESTYRAAAHQFDVLGPTGFDQRHKFQLNDWRRAYPLPISHTS